MTSRTQAASAFLNEARQAWDSREPWESTAAEGCLAYSDAEVLAGMCEDTGEAYDRAEREVVAYCREKMASK